MEYGVIVREPLDYLSEKFTKGNMMLNFRVAWLLIALAVLAGCRTYPNSGNKDAHREYGQRNHPYYKGELYELDVIGVDLKSEVSDDEIANAAVSTSRTTIPVSSSIMLIQSGAMTPDEGMVKELEKYYNLSVFSGIPADGGNSGAGYSRSLRLAAAKSGADKLVVCWGVLETNQEDLPAKTISWRPLSGENLHDAKQRLRMRIKIAIVGVKSGQWEMFTPEPFESSTIDSHSHKIAVATLKSNAYQAAANDFIKRYAK